MSIVSNALLELSKDLNLNLKKANFPDLPPLATHLHIDCSGSMEHEFRVGWVDRAINLFVAAAMKFDSDGVLEVGAFNTKYTDHLPILGCEHDTDTRYTQAVGMYASGGTAFAPALRMFVADERAKAQAHASVASRIFSIFRAEEKTTPCQADYVGFITDGENSDPEETEEVLRSIPVDQVFIQVIGIGNYVSRPYLNALEARFPNVSVIYLPDPHSTSDTVFYEHMCNAKFKNWLETIYKPA